MKKKIDHFVRSPRLQEIVKHELDKINEIEQILKDLEDADDII